MTLPKVELDAFPSGQKVLNLAWSGYRQIINELQRQCNHTSGLLTMALLRLLPRRSQNLSSTSLVAKPLQEITSPNRQPCLAPCSAGSNLVESRHLGCLPPHGADLPHAACRVQPCSIWVPCFLVRAKCFTSCHAACRGCALCDASFGWNADALEITSLATDRHLA